MIKIKEYKIRREGLRGLTVTVPKVWFDDLGLAPGDTVDIYRDETDRLILEARKAEKEPA